MNNLQIYNLWRKKPSLKHGILLTVEGIDGAGKFTQVKFLTEYLENEGYKVKNFAFPRYETFIGKVISSYLKGEYGDISQVPYELISMAYASDRAQAGKEIRALLNAGYVVICDRYTYSNIFSAAKMPEEKWMDFISWIEEMEFNQMDVVKPNYNFYLHVDPEVSINRIKERGKRDYQDGKEDIHENNFTLLRNTSKAYLKLAKNRDDWFVINQMKNGKQLSKEEIFSLLKEKINEILNEKGS